MASIKLAPEIVKKTPTGKQACDMDFSADLSPGETILEILDYTVTPAGSLLIESMAFSGGVAQPWLVAGTHGVTYRVWIKIRTTRGQIFEGYGDILVAD